MRAGGTPAERLAIAEVVLRYAEAAGAAEAEVLVMAEDAALTRLLGDSRLPDRLDAMSRVIRGYDGCASLVQCMEERW